MQQQLINLNPDLKKLQDEGYIVEIDGGGGHVLVHHIPYLNSAKEIKYGTLVCTLTLSSPNRIGKPADHTIFFCGDAPHNADGTRLDAIINNSNQQRLTGKIVADHMFSSKPSSGNYINYYEKFRTYSEILQTQARIIDRNVTSRPKKMI